MLQAKPIYNKCYVTTPRLLFMLMLDLLCDDSLTYYCTCLRHFMLLRHNVFLSSSDVELV